MPKIPFRALCRWCLTHFTPTDLYTILVSAPPDSEDYGRALIAVLQTPQSDPQPLNVSEKRRRRKAARQAELARRVQRTRIRLAKQRVIAAKKAKRQAHREAARRQAREQKNAKQRKQQALRRAEQEVARQLRKQQRTDQRKEQARRRAEREVARQVARQTRQKAAEQLRALHLEKREAAKREAARQITEHQEAERRAQWVLHREEQPGHKTHPVRRERRRSMAAAFCDRIPIKDVAAQFSVTASTVRNAISEFFGMKTGKCSRLLRLSAAGVELAAAANEVGLSYQQASRCCLLAGLAAQWRTAPPTPPAEFDERLRPPPQ